VFELHQGDCLEMPAIPSDSVDMVFADLPYGVTRNAGDAVIPFEILWEQYLRIGKDNANFVFTRTQPFATALIMSQPRLFKYEWIWEKCQAKFYSYEGTKVRQHPDG
jgi:site-specific DNA-methyltransferase (adenine-specific)